MAAKALEELAPHARAFAESVGLLAPVQILVGGLTDRLELRREVRRLEAVKRAADKIEALGLPPAAIRDRVLRDVLEGAADEEDGQMAELWSNLLANAAIGTEVAPSYPAVLRQLESVEARLLDAVVQRQPVLIPAAGVLMDDDLDAVVPELEWRHLDNLERLGLLTFETTLPGNVELPERPTGLFPRVSVSVNPYGRAFVKACTQPSAQGR